MNSARTTAGTQMAVLKRQESERGKSNRSINLIKRGILASEAISTDTPNNTALGLQSATIIKQINGNVRLPNAVPNQFHSKCHNYLIAAEDLHCHW